MLDFSKVPFPDAPTGATFKQGFEPEPPGALPNVPAPSPPPTPNLPASGAVVDLPAAKRALALFDTLLTSMEQAAKDIVVDSAISAADATEMAAQALRLSDQIDAKRKEKIKIPDGFVRQLNGFVKPMQDRIEALAGKRGILKRKLGDYATRVELGRRETERKQKEAADRLQAELDAEAKAKNIEPVKLAPVAVPMKSGPIRSDSGSSSSKMVTIAEIKDLSAVPRNYLEAVFKKKSHLDGDAPLDGTTEAIWSRLQTAIMEAYSAGLRVIEGVEFMEKSSISVRRVG